MKKKYVITPDGKKTVAGILHAPCAYVIDLILGFLIISFVPAFFGDIENVFIIAPLLFMLLIYVLFSSKLGISLGWWATGLKCYKYEDIEEYNGKGKLIVQDILYEKEHTKRAIIAVAVLSVLYGIINFVHTTINSAA